VLPVTKVVIVNLGTSVLTLWRQHALLRSVTTCRVCHCIELEEFSLIHYVWMQQILVTAV